MSNAFRAEWTTRATASKVLRLALYANCKGSEKLEEKGFMISRATLSASFSIAEEQAIGRKDLGPKLAGFLGMGVILTVRQASGIFDSMKDILMMCVKIGAI